MGKRQEKYIKVSLIISIFLLLLSWNHAGASGPSHGPESAHLHCGQ